MMMKRSNIEARAVFYRSRFAVSPAQETDVEIWPQIIRTLQNWLEDKEWKKSDRLQSNLLTELTDDVENYSMHFDSALQSCYLSRRFATGSFDDVACETSLLTTKAVVGRGTEYAPEFWVMDYLEQDSTLWYRRWSTNVGITSMLDGSYVVNVRVSILDDASHIEAQTRMPSRNTPNFIRGMLDIAGCITEAGCTRLSSDPVELTAGNFMRFVNELTSRERAVPYLVVSSFYDGEQSGFTIDANELAKKLRGSAVVFRLDRSEYRLRQAYNNVFGIGAIANAYRINNGAMRVFFPQVNLALLSFVLLHRF